MPSTGPGSNKLASCSATGTTMNRTAAISGRSPASQGWATGTGKARSMSSRAPSMASLPSPARTGETARSIWPSSSSLGL